MMSLGPSLPLAPCYHPRAGINKGQTSLPSSAHNKGSAWSYTASPHGPVWTRSLASRRWSKRATLAKSQNIMSSKAKLDEQKANMIPCPCMEEGRKRVLAIVAGILVARHLKTTDDLFDSRPSPRTESLIASAVQWAERIMRRIDGTFGKS